MNKLKIKLKFGLVVLTLAGAGLTACSPGGGASSSGQNSELATDAPLPQYPLSTNSTFTEQEYANYTSGLNNN